VVVKNLNISLHCFHVLVCVTGYLFDVIILYLLVLLYCCTPPDTTIPDLLLVLFLYHNAWYSSYMCPSATDI